MKTGIHKLSFSDYTDIEAVRQSDLKHMQVSPLQYKHAIDNRMASTSEMEFGTAAHTYILEPENFSNEVVVFSGKVRNGKAWDQFNQENAGKIIIREVDLEKLQNMAAAFRSHPFTKHLLEHSEVEQSLIWEDQETGIFCKSRRDIKLDGVIYDYKTTANIADEAIHFSAKNYGYREQSAFYLDAETAVTGDPHKEFIFIFQQKEAPYDINILSASERFIEYGRQRNRAALRGIAECRKTGTWPGKYQDAIGVIDISEFEATTINL